MTYSEEPRDVAGIIRALVERIAAGEQAAVDELTPAVERLEVAADVLTRMARSDEDPLPDEDPKPLERSGGDVERSGGQLLEQVIHLYDLACWYLGEPRAVTAAIAGLCHLGDPAIPVLMEMLGDESGDLRHAALEALAELDVSVAVMGGNEVDCEKCGGTGTCPCLGMY